MSDKCDVSHFHSLSIFSDVAVYIRFKTKKRTFAITDCAENKAFVPRESVILKRSFEELLLSCCFFMVNSYGHVIPTALSFDRLRPPKRLTSTFVRS